jgi:hypothetical protein
MGRNNLKGPGPGRPKGSRNKEHKDIAAVIDTIRRVSYEDTVAEAVNGLWRDKPEVMVGFFKTVAPKDLTLRAPDGLGGVQMDLTKLNDVELTTFAMLAKKAQK